MTCNSKDFKDTTAIFVTSRKLKNQKAAVLYKVAVEKL